MEVYSWLLPQDMRDAQTEIALLKVQLAEEKAKNEKLVAAAASAAKSGKREKISSKKKAQAPSLSPASRSTGSSSNTSSDDDTKAVTTSPKKKEKDPSPAAKSAPKSAPLKVSGTPVGRGIVGIGAGSGGGLANDGVLNFRRPQAKRGKTNAKRFQSNDSSDKDEDDYGLASRQGIVQGGVIKSPPLRGQAASAGNDHDF